MSIIVIVTSLSTIENSTRVYSKIKLTRFILNRFLTRDDKTRINNKKTTSTQQAKIQ